jgi:hypothetical protein
MQLHSYVLTTAKIGSYSTNDKIESIKRFLSVMYQIPYTDIIADSNHPLHDDYLATFCIDNSFVHLHRKKTGVNNASKV